MKPRLREGVKEFSTQGLMLHGVYGRSVEEFITIAKMKYGDYYSYKSVVYSYAKSPVEIICKKHGPFSRTPYEFLKGLDCPHCRKEDFFRAGPVKRKKGTGLVHCRWDKERFLAAAREMHGDKYDYSKVGDITSQNQKITIVCPRHGEFAQRVAVHLKGSGCLPCGNEKKSRDHTMPFSEFLRRARKVHGDKYQYVESSYTFFSKPITIICPVHGEFKQTGQKHAWTGHGCPQCGKLSNISHRTKPFADFVKKARKIHGDKYRYVESTYIKNHANLTIICPIHGEFRQTGNSHLGGHGCVKCGYEVVGKKNSILRKQYFAARKNQTPPDGGKNGRPGEDKTRPPRPAAAVSGKKKPPLPAPSG
ncbi:MAG: hypothetical protein LBG84_07320 [Treponema sp.]|jgi:transcription elongation factor Elf1|nr:hypothetical protein [Treponema sp.]